MTALQEAAFAEFNRLAASDELRMDYKLQPGDIQLLHNHSIVHCRSGFEDYNVGAPLHTLVGFVVSLNLPELGGMTRRCLPTYAIVT